ncbi:MAG: L-isoaspartyl protein carboxyl methyltransferase [Sulfurovum sp.]|nr:MAG: L-isoaspartyl protein carboxyl methyltransferase [Sulfurovum sp.]
MKTMYALVDEMVVSGMLQSPEIIDAFRAVDRKYFVPDSIIEHTYVDAPLSIGNNQTISQPSTVAFMLEHLEVQEGDRVLDIGSGSGWTTALLCHIVGEKGHVSGLERVVALVDQGKKNLTRFNPYSRCHIQRAGEKLGLPGKRFDRILVSASAEQIPEELFSQLNVEGILVIPVANSIFKFTKISESEVEKEEFYGFVFVPLIY